MKLTTTAIRGLLEKALAMREAMKQLSHLEEARSAGAWLDTLLSSAKSTGVLEVSYLQGAVMEAEAIIRIASEQD